MSFKVIENKPVTIQVPDQEFLGLPDGFDLAESVMRPLLKGIVEGPQKIIVVIPQERPLRLDGGRGTSTIMGAFFASFFQELLVALRGHNMPDLKYAAARENIRAVAGEEKRDLSASDIASMLFDKPWKTYADLENLFWDKVSIGLISKNGEIILAEIAEGRQFLNEVSTDEGRKLFHWVYQVSRGLDGAFSWDLKLERNSFEQLKSRAARRDKGLDAHP